MWELWKPILALTSLWTPPAYCLTVPRKSLKGRMTFLIHHVLNNNSGFLTNGGSTCSSLLFFLFHGCVQHFRSLAVGCVTAGFAALEGISTLWIWGADYTSTLFGTQLFQHRTLTRLFVGHFTGHSITACLAALPCEVRAVFVNSAEICAGLQRHANNGWAHPRPLCYVCCPCLLQVGPQEEPDHHLD